MNDRTKKGMVAAQVITGLLSWALSVLLGLMVVGIPALVLVWAFTGAFLWGLLAGLVLGVVAGSIFNFVVGKVLGWVLDPIFNFIWDALGLPDKSKEDEE